MPDDHGDDRLSQPTDVSGEAPPIDDETFADSEAWLDDETTDDDESPGQATDIEPAPLVPALESWLPLLEHRSPNEWVCPFLRSVDTDGVLALPIESPQAANRCAALHEAVPQSLRQQELVCLTNGHVSCPRYLRGALGITETTKPAVRVRPSVTPAILTSLALLVFAFALSAAFVVGRGGLTLSAVAIPSPSPEDAAVAPSSTVAPSPDTVATPEPTPAATPTPVATPTPTPMPSPSPTSVPTAEPSVTPQPSSDRYALLDPCPDEPDCWIYTIRSGDNLYSIANYFGVRLSQVYKLNPWARTSGLRAGQELILPPPTR